MASCTRFVRVQLNGAIRLAAKGRKERKRIGSREASVAATCGNRPITDTKFSRHGFRITSTFFAGGARSPATVLPFLCPLRYFAAEMSCRKSARVVRMQLNGPIRSAAKGRNVRKKESWTFIGGRSTTPQKIQRLPQRRQSQIDELATVVLAAVDGDGVFRAGLEEHDLAFAEPLSLVVAGPAVFS